MSTVSRTGKATAGARHQRWRGRPVILSTGSRISLAREKQKSSHKISSVQVGSMAGDRPSGLDR